MRYSDQGYTKKQVIAITDKFILANGLMNNRFYEHGKVSEHLKEFGDIIKDGVVLPLLPYWIRPFAPKLPDRPKKLTPQTQAKIDVLMERRSMLFHQSLAINIKKDVTLIDLEIAALKRNDPLNKAKK